MKIAQLLAVTIACNFLTLGYVAHADATGPSIAVMPHASVEIVNNTHRAFVPFVNETSEWGLRTTGLWALEPNTMIAAHQRTKIAAHGAVPSSPFEMSVEYRACGASFGIESKPGDAGRSVTSGHRSIRVYSDGDIQLTVMIRQQSAFLTDALVTIDDT